MALSAHQRRRRAVPAWGPVTADEAQSPTAPAASAQSTARGDPGPRREDRQASTSRLGSWVGPLSWVLGGVLAFACLLAAPRTPDLAAAAFRAQLFADHGPLLYNALWYSGMNNVAYSVVFPPLGALLGIRVVGALASVAAVVLFERIVTGWAKRRGGLAAVAFALTVSSNLLIGRIAFALGVAIALGSVLALQREHVGLSCGLAALCALTSSLAAFFLALAGAAFALGGIRGFSDPAGAALAGDWRRGLAGLRVPGLLLSAAALVPAVALQWAFPEPGAFGFAPATFEQLIVVLVGVAVILPPGTRTLRIGAVLYAAAAVVAYKVPSPLGQSIDRMAALFAAPLVLAAPWRARRLPVAVVAAGLLLWYAWLPVARDLPASGQPSSTDAFYAPLNRFLAARDHTPTRVEIPFTRGRWETALVARQVMIARGWERQIDVRTNPLFYAGTLSPSRYLAWLQANAVGLVALPRLAVSQFDYYGQAEVQLLSRPQPFLQPVWRTADWTVFAVIGGTPLLQGPGRLLSTSADGFRFEARRAGRFIMRLHDTPYWAISSGAGCVQQAPGGWTEIDVRRAGPVAVAARFSLGRLVAGGGHCD